MSQPLKLYEYTRYDASCHTNTDDKEYVKYSFFTVSKLWWNVLINNLTMFSHKIFVFYTFNTQPWLLLYKTLCNRFIDRKESICSLQLAANFAISEEFKMCCLSTHEGFRQKSSHISGWNPQGDRINNDDSWSTFIIKIINIIKQLQLKTNFVI